MNQIERLHFIYQLLEIEPRTVQDICKELAKAGYTTANRQIYNDLLQLEKSYLRKNQQLQITTGQHNQKTYRLVYTDSSISVTGYDVNSYQLSRLSMTTYITEGRGDSINKFRDIVAEKIMHLSKTKYTTLPIEQNFNSHFFERKYSADFNKISEDIIWSIANNKIIEIVDIYGDATAVTKEITYPIKLKALLLVYHNGAYYTAGFTEKKNEFLTIDLSKIVAYNITNQTFAHKKALPLAKAELQKRFGLTGNIDKEVYDIELEFSSITGEFLSHYHWHESQTFSILKNGNYRMKMHCGINRELFGWIFRWMGNVKIIGPQKLKELYLEQLTIINKNYATNQSLSYTNIFKPKNSKN
ncbi:MAG: WYL domain-containing protein [Bacteroidetes bacterium]|nr:WYL domain-containing protein [Bacteroidota bacterium]